MEAMAKGKIVLAPSITGIPELIIPGKTGFLYQPGDLEDFVHRIRFLQSLMRVRKSESAELDSACGASARFSTIFSREENLNRFRRRIPEIDHAPQLEPFP